MLRGVCSSKVKLGLCSRLINKLSAFGCSKCFGLIGKEGPTSFWRTFLSYFCLIRVKISFFESSVDESIVLSVWSVG